MVRARPLVFTCPPCPTFHVRSHSGCPFSLPKKIRGVYPNLSLDHLELNRDGLINDVVIVNGKLVYRFPRTEWAKNILAHEARVLDVWDPWPYLRL